MIQRKNFTKTLTIYLFIQAQVILSFVIIQPIYVIFLLKNGLTLFAVSIVGTIFSLGIIIFEIPTGGLADVYGRKNSIMSGQLLTSISFLIYANSHYLWQFIIAEIIHALAITFVSGALDAWVVDTLPPEVNKQKLFSMKNILIPIAMILGSLVGGYLGNINLKVPFLLSSTLGFIGWIITIIFVKEKQNSYITQKEISVILRKSINFVLKHQNVYILILASSLLSFFTGPIFMFWQPFFLNLLKSQNLSFTGWIYAFISLSLTIGSYLGGRVESRKRTTSFKVFFLLNGVFIIISASWQYFILSLSFFFLQKLARGVIMPIFDTWLNELVPTSERATILSLNSMVSELASAIGIFSLGIVANHFSIQASWIISSFILIILSIPLFTKLPPKFDSGVQSY